VLPEIMVPHVVTVEELNRIADLVRRVHGEVEAAYGVKVALKFGSMIEVVRARLRAARMAETAEFFSFGTSDLTPATLSFARENAENKCLPL
jgi:pyruvate,orthophosphate dikinase